MTDDSSNQHPEPVVVASYPDRGEAEVHAPAHLMFYAPYATEKDLGTPPPGMNMPRLIRAGQPDAVMIVFPAQKTNATH